MKTTGMRTAIPEKVTQNTSSLVNIVRFPEKAKRKISFSQHLNMDIRRRFNGTTRVCLQLEIIFFLILIFYCYSIIVVCLFSPSLHPIPAEPPSLLHLHPPP